LPARFRDAALFGSLGKLETFAKMLRRQGDDYMREIMDQVDLISGNKGPSFSFSRHLVGDFSGNISVGSVKDLLLSFCIKDCWNSFRLLAADIGFGIPSVENVLSGLIRNRHRSAYVAGFSPTLNDTQSLPANLTCVGLCFDAAITASARRAIDNWTEWQNDAVDWRSHLQVYLIDPKGTHWRLQRSGRTRALRVTESRDLAYAAVPPASHGEVALAVFRDLSGIPEAWRISP
jgi:hypothetical protein